jgi:CHAD domain-containing protein
MKARAVRKLDPKGTLRDNAARVIRVRVDELHSFDPAIRRPSAVRELHDMRIAAKRLRYVLEIAGFAFGGEGRRSEDVAKGLQELLGEIHDCDVLVPLVDDHVASLRRVDVEALTTAGHGPGGLDGLRRAVHQAPNAARYRGLEVLAAATTARRALLYERFLERWDELREEGWRQRLEAALAKGR